jgi:hypothetical protein
LPEDTPYFYAQYRQEYPVEHGKDYLILDTKGKGHYVGTVLAVRTRSPEWFGEGDEKIYIDGEQTASIWGTGTEDYFLMAWGLRPVQYALLRLPLLRSMGDCRQPCRSLSLAYQRSAHLQHRHPVTIEHWGWMSPDENPDYKEHELERARRRLFQRGVLVSDRRADLR